MCPIGYLSIYWRGKKNEREYTRGTPSLWKTVEQMEVAIPYGMGNVATFAIGFCRRDRERVFAPHDRHGVFHAEHRRSISDGTDMRRCSLKEGKH